MRLSRTSPPSDAPAQRGRRGLWIVLGIAAIAAAAAAAWYFAFRGSGNDTAGQSTAPTATAPTSDVAAPASIRFPSDPTRPGLNAAGIAKDGWLSRDVTFSLAGGPAAVLALRGDVLGGMSQGLSLFVDGREVDAGPISAGALDLRVPVPSSDRNRRIELRFAREVALKPPDKRSAAARLESAAVVVPTEAPATLTLPAALAQANVASSGFYADGWARRQASVLVSGGPTAALGVNLLNLAARQNVDVVVDSRTVLSQQLPRGATALDVPIEASAGPRLVQLRFARAPAISKGDPRPAAGLVRSIAVRSLTRSAPAVVTPPADVRRHSIIASGIYDDGWAQQTARVVLAGGPATTLTLKAQTILKGQQVTAFLDGSKLGSAPMHPGNDVVRVHVASSKSPRLLELRFARVAPIAGNDPRPAATLLRSVALARSAAVKKTAASPSHPGRLHARLTTSAQVPPQSGPGSGTLTATIVNGELRWQLRVENLSGPVIAAVLRIGKPGQQGPRLVYLCTPCENESSGTVRLTGSQQSTIRNGGTYVNVGTGSLPNGEIRGQLTPG